MYIYIYIYIYTYGSSTMPSRHSIPQDLYSPCLNLANYARSMFTPTMFFTYYTRYVYIYIYTYILIDIIR